MSSTQEVGDIFGAGKGPAMAMLRSPTVLIVSIGLWGMNIFFYNLFHLDYSKILMLDVWELEQDEESERSMNCTSKTKNKSRQKEGMSKKYDDNSNHDTLKEENEFASSSSIGEEIELSLSSFKRKQTDISPSSVDTASSMEALLLLHNDLESNGMSNTARLSKTNTSTTNTNTTKATSKLKANATSATSISDFVKAAMTIDYSTADYIASGMAITWYKLVLFSIILLCLLHFTTHFWMDHLGKSSIGAVFSFYGAVLFYIGLPLSQNGWLRRALVIVLQRSFELLNPRCGCLLFPGRRPRKIPFVDVFYADAMCSLSKVFFDWGLLLHQASHYPNPVPAAAHNIILPSLCASVPYVIRARQCLVMYTYSTMDHDLKHACQHLMNALKYSTSIFPLILSAYQKTLSDPMQASNLEPYLIGLLIINASYSLYWDIVMDWGMMQDPYKVAQTVTGCAAPPPVTPSTGPNDHPKEVLSATNGSNSSVTFSPTTPLSHPSQHSCHHVCLRPRLRFGLTLSALIVIADAFLRFSWTLRFITRFPSNDAYVLCTQFLEVFRRAIWNLLRVEWENIKQKREEQVATTTSSKSKGKLRGLDEYSENDEADEEEINTVDDGQQRHRTFLMMNKNTSSVPKTNPKGSITAFPYRHHHAGYSINHRGDFGNGADETNHNNSDGVSVEMKSLLS